jgi:hypothetical protein
VLGACGVGGAQHLGRVLSLVDRIGRCSGRLRGAFTLASSTEGLLEAGHGSRWLAPLGGGELLRIDQSRR